VTVDSTATAAGTTPAPLTTAQVIDRCRAEGRAALVAYLPVGFPTVQRSIDAARALVEAGVDVIEFGLPYSDPVMDGAVIQQAATAALAGGVRTGDVLRAVGEVSGRGAAVVVMTYWNPVLAYGVDRFARELAANGGGGLITPDLTPDEAGEWIAASEAHGLDRIFLVAPSSPPDRLAYVAGHTRGFVYAASTMGVTGTRAAVGDRAEDLVRRTRAAGAERVCVGLGVSNGEQAREIAAYADGVIVGSAFVRSLLEEDDAAVAHQRLTELVHDLRSGIDAAGAPDLTPTPA
jgi:tryptophan synthase alpha chain